MSKDLIVAVTGASGFIGSHIALKLLEAGYTVRLLARGQKADRLRNTIAKDNAKVQVVTITDIVTDTLSAAFQDTYAVIHTASPLAGRVDVKASLTSAVEGSLNVLKQAERCGVKKVVLTATWASAFDPGDTKSYWSEKRITSKDWGHVTREQVLNEEHDPFWVYCATKLLAELACWKYAEEHPKIDVATLNPPFIYGPFAQGFPAPANSMEISTNLLLYRLIVGQKGGPLPPQIAPHFCDVRDVAEAHVRALDVPPAPNDVQSKRFLMFSGHFVYQDVVKLLAEKRPDLKDRLPSLQNAPLAPGPLSIVDISGVEKELKMKDPIPWEQSVMDAFDDLTKAEKEWR